MEQKNKIEEVINSLEGIQKASPGNFFFTRVQAKLKKDELGFWGHIAGFITKPAVALATLCLICLLNAAALFYQHQSSSNTGLSEQFEQTPADEYNTTVAANSYYDENMDPR